MRNIGENIWVHEDSMRLAGTRLSLRMTMVKLSDGSLWVHSPTKLNAQLKTQIQALGDVKHIVAASNGHNLWLRQWQDAFPDAAVYVSPGIVKKLKLTDYHLLDESFENLWRDDLECEYMLGVPFFNESLFLHKKTKSLIATDLIQHHPDKQPVGLSASVAKFIFTRIGFKDICLAPPLKLGFMIKDKEKFASCFKNVLGWDFEKIIVTHGDIIEDNAKQTLTNLCDRFYK